MPRGITSISGQHAEEGSPVEASFEASWGPLGGPGRLSERLGCFGELPGASWGSLGGLLEASWGPVDASWVLLGASWGPLESLLGALGALFEPSWAILEPS
eukprot:5225871-Pyramimonas_sp.AAC.1